jgi:hypothetical protein
MVVLPLTGAYVSGNIAVTGAVDEAATVLKNVFCAHFPWSMLTGCQQHNQCRKDTQKVEPIKLLQKP